MAVAGIPGPPGKNTTGEPGFGAVLRRRTKAIFDQAILGTPAILTNPKIAQFGRMPGAIVGPKRIRFQAQFSGMMRLRGHGCRKGRERDERGR